MLKLNWLALASDTALFASSISLPCISASSALNSSIDCVETQQLLDSVRTWTLLSQLRIIPRTIILSCETTSFQILFKIKQNQSGLCRETSYMWLWNFGPLSGKRLDVLSYGSVIFYDFSIHATKNRSQHWIFRWKTFATLTADLTFSCFSISSLFSCWISYSLFCCSSSTAWRKKKRHIQYKERK